MVKSAHIAGNSYSIWTKWRMDDYLGLHFDIGPLTPVSYTHLDVYKRQVNMYAHRDVMISSRGSLTVLYTDR